MLENLKTKEDVRAAIERDPLGFFMAVWDAENADDTAVWEQVIVDFAARERIHTESSYKYTPRSIAAVLRQGGFRLERTWTDTKKWFSTVLARA